jgi:RNA polymerase sigma factor (sigma-70 family)
VNEPASAAQKPSDAEAIGRSLGDPAAFGLVFERHFALLYRFISLRVGEELAADLASETFAIAFRRRVDYDRTRPDARPWLVGIAINLTRQQWRRERRLKRALVRFPRERCEQPHEAAADKLDALASAPVLRNVLRELPRKDRDLLLLFACMEFSYGEIAEALSLPIGTVRSRIHRLRRKLRGRLRASREGVSV